MSKARATKVKGRRPNLTDSESGSQELALNVFFAFIFVAGAAATINSLIQTTDTQANDAAGWVQCGSPLTCIEAAPLPGDDDGGAGGDTDSGGGSGSADDGGSGGPAEVPTGF